jgi:hypothetical protein
MLGAKKYSPPFMVTHEAKPRGSFPPLPHTLGYRARPSPVLLLSWPEKEFPPEPCAITGSGPAPVQARSLSPFMDLAEGVGIVEEGPGSKRPHDC